MISKLYRVRAAARRRALFGLDLAQEGAIQEIVPLGASLLRTADVGQADLGPGLEERRGWQKYNGIEIQWNRNTME